MTAGDGRRFCTSCGTWAAAFRADGKGNPDRGCPGCKSLERHRFLALLVPALVARGHVETALDVAPTQALATLVDSLVPRRLGMDFDPSADGRTVTARASVTHLPLPDGCIDLVLCSHVLEHVPDDHAAMRELARVLAPAATGVVVVPRRRGRPTDEDPGASPAERVERFGQADHVRYYGDDFVERLRANGLSYDEVTPQLLLPEAVWRTCGFMPSETFWLVRRADAGPEREPTSRDELSAALLGELMRLFADADARHVAARVAPVAAVASTSAGARTYLRRARRRYRRLRGPVPVRLVRLGWAALKKLAAARR